MALIAQKNMLSVTFLTSTSQLFPAALEIATQADEFAEEPVGKIKRYRTTFGAIRKQAELAVALLQHLDNIKGVLMRAGGRLVIDQDAIIQTLGCFITALAGGGASCDLGRSELPVQRHREEKRSSDHRALTARTDACLN